MHGGAGLRCSSPSGSSSVGPRASGDAPDDVLYEGPAKGGANGKYGDVAPTRTRGLRVVQSVVCTSASTGGCSSCWDASHPGLRSLGLRRRAMGHHDPEAERDEKKQPHETRRHFPSISAATGKLVTSIRLRLDITPDGHHHSKRCAAAKHALLQEEQAWNETIPAAGSEKGLR